MSAKVELDTLPISLPLQAEEIHLDTINQTCIVSIRDSQKINVRAFDLSNFNQKEEFNYVVNHTNIRWFKWLPLQQTMVMCIEEKEGVRIYYEKRTGLGLWTGRQSVGSNFIKSETAKQPLVKWTSSLNLRNHLLTFSHNQSLTLMAFVDSIENSYVFEEEFIASQCLITDEANVLILGKTINGIHEARRIDLKDNNRRTQVNLLTHQQRDLAQGKTPQYGSLNTKIQFYLNSQEGHIFLIRWGHYDGEELMQFDAYVYQVSNLKLLDSFQVKAKYLNIQQRYFRSPSEVKNHIVLYPLLLTIKNASYINKQLSINAIYQRYGSMNFENLISRQSVAEAYYLFQVSHLNNLDILKGTFVPLNQLIVSTNKKSVSSTAYIQNSESHDLRTGCFLLSSNGSYRLVFNDNTLNYLSSNKYRLLYDGQNSVISSSSILYEGTDTKNKVTEKEDRFQLLPGSEYVSLSSSKIICLAMHFNEPRLLIITYTSDQ